MTKKLDLGSLAIDHGAAARPAASARHAIWTRYVLPAAILVGFAALLAWSLRDQLLPGERVTVVPVILTRAEVGPSSQPLFQAAGWVEPRPTRTLVPALASGVIETILVVEGQDVRSGDPIARLIDVDALAGVQAAKIDLELRQSELTLAEAQRVIAATRLNQPVHLEAELAQARSALAAKQTELAAVPFRLSKAKARLLLARQELQGKRAAVGAVAGRAVQEAQRELDAAQAEFEELENAQPHLQREVDALEQRHQALSKQLELKVDESRLAAEAEGAARAADAQVRLAQLALEAAELRLERMVVRAPHDGRVLELVARPGSRMMGLAPDGRQDAGTVVTLYDPQSLQVRADVRLEDVPLLEPGQPARIEAASASGVIEGHVLLPTSEANVQKNTLEVKVAIHDPPSTLRPEMLVQVTFLPLQQPESPSQDTAARQSTPRHCILAPEELIQREGEHATVWVADPSGAARRQTVRLGPAGVDGWVEIADGLNATDKLITSGRENLRDGQRIRVIDERSEL